MAAEAQAVSTVEEVHEVPHKHNRRYVGTKETIAYVMYDISMSFNIDKYRDVFLTDILIVNFAFQTFVNGVIGVWDIINDVFLAALVDKTRTRFGKFRPYLILYAIPGVALTLFYWFMPYIFAGTGSHYAPKLAAYLILQFISNLAGSLNNIARTGMLATITPNIIERTRLITQANLFSGFVEKAPEILMGVLIDLVDHGALKVSMRSLYVSGGVFTTLVAGGLAFYFVIVAKERVIQSVEKPAIKDSIKSLITNKPLLLITLEQFLSAFSINSGLNFYYINVLGLASMSTIVGIPGAVVSPLSYSYVPKAREKLSTKTLWILGSHTDNVLLMGVFLIGSLNKNFKKLGVMIPAFMLRETLWMTVYGIKKVIPEEMRNEAIDYGEWKTGFRTEGMTGVTKDLATKAVSTVGAMIRTAILGSIGYKQGAGFGGQSESTEYKLFATSTALPVVTGLLAIIPKFFYDLSGEKRERMYNELYARRKAMEDKVNEEDSKKGLNGETLSD